MECFGDLIDTYGLNRKACSILFGIYSTANLIDVGYPNLSLCSCYQMRFKDLY